MITSSRSGFIGIKKNAELTPREDFQQCYQIIAEFERVRDELDCDVCCENGLVILREPTNEEIEDDRSFWTEYYDYCEYMEDWRSGYVSD